MRPPRSINLRAVGICAALAVGASLGVFAPAALAAPPNDQFANRTNLGDQLPVHLSESNVGATKETTGEPRIGRLTSAGHSIWWGWEAPATEWVTVSTCESGFPTVLNIFEGSELGHLTPLTVENINGDEGPACWASGTTFTFHAVAGSDYVIGADGDGYYVPPPPPEEAHIPAGEGTIDLSIEATLPPPNDEFAAATRIGNNFLETRESPFEEPNDDRYFWEATNGYNWGATKEAGEPDHAGDLGGASVWYAWTPSESGEARISLQGAGGPKLLALYRGSSLAELVPVASSVPGGSFASLSAEVSAGTEYRIAVDGSQTENSVEPWRGSFMGSFQLAIQWIVPPPPPPPAAAPAPTTPAAATPVPPAPVPSTPNVKVAGLVVDPQAGGAVIRFGSAVDGAKFQCKVDGKGFKACSSPFKVRGLRPGKHRVEVVARYLGKVDPSPAVVHFTVPKPHGRPHAAG